ncbi:MAG TPA: E3 binding domain-containing protein, partial [Tessaracoccus flavescens]|nr:E3 binding domain-containing protein [Tessaracoccus flavescens]
MKQQFLLPDPGEGLLEAEIVAWRVTVGETIEVNDVLVEIETAKSLVELPSPFAGEVVALLVEEGSTVEVGTPIVVIDDGEPEAQVVNADTTGADGAPAAAASQANGASASVSDASGPNLVGYGASDAPSRRRRRGAASSENGAKQEVSEAVSAAYEQHEPGRRADEVHPASPVHAMPTGDPLPTPGKAPSESTLVLASDPNDSKAKPPVRKYAKDLGVDLSTVVGTGPDGSITRRDVEAAAAFRALEDEA